MVQALRNGTHQIEPGQIKSDEPIKFSKISLSGSSVGGLISHIEAYTFSDVNALSNIVWGDCTVTPFAIQEFADAAGRRRQGGCASHRERFLT